MTLEAVVLQMVVLSELLAANQERGHIDLAEAQLLEEGCMATAHELSVVGLYSGLLELVLEVAHTSSKPRRAGRVVRSLMGGHNC